MTGATLRDLGLAQVANSHPEFVTIARKTLAVNALAPLLRGRKRESPRSLVVGVCQIGHCLSRNPSRRAGTQRVWAFAVPKIEPPPQGKQEKEEYYFRPKVLIKKPGWRKFQAYRAQY